MRHLLLLMPARAIDVAEIFSTLLLMLFAIFFCRASAAAAALLMPTTFRLRRSADALF